jgi:hypothetical protein
MAKYAPKAVLAGGRKRSNRHLTSAGHPGLKVAWMCVVILTIIFCKSLSYMLRKVDSLAKSLRSSAVPSRVLMMST